MSELSEIKSSVYSELTTALQDEGVVTRRLQAPEDTLPASAYGLHIGVPSTVVVESLSDGDEVEDEWTLTLAVRVGNDAARSEADLLEIEEAITILLSSRLCCPFRFQSADRSANPKEIRSTLTYTTTRLELHS